MASLVIVIKSPQTRAELVQLYQKPTGAPKEEAVALKTLLHSVAGGIKPIAMDVYASATDPVAASGTATLASVLANDTITIGKTTLTAKAVPATEDEFSQAGTDTQDAVSLAAKINAHSVLSKLVSATSALGVVTITVLAKGEIGNQVVLVSSNARIAVTGSGYMASGTGGVTEAAVHYSLGLA